MVKKLLFWICIGIMIGVGGTLGYQYMEMKNRKEAPVVVKEKPLMKYAFESLRTTPVRTEEVLIGDKIKENKDSDVYAFSMRVPSEIGNTRSSIMSGVMNIPKKNGTYPVIVMFRGYADAKTYRSGVGTERSAEAYASAGFLTIAPDFLGYGSSSSPSANPWENRFQSYTSAVSVLSSIETINDSLKQLFKGSKTIDPTKVGIWGHSNGGSIALSVLAITQKNYPTVLWAPVSKGFPYSVLYYTDEFDDQGKSLRDALAKFEADYDVEKFSPLNYYNGITGAVQIHQGTADVEVPVWWSDELVALLKKNKLTVDYNTYPGADHNLMPSGWNPAVERSTLFFQTKLGKK